MKIRLHPISSFSYFAPTSLLTQMAPSGDQDAAVGCTGSMPSMPLAHTSFTRSLQRQKLSSSLAKASGTRKSWLGELFFPPSTISLPTFYELATYLSAASPSIRSQELIPGSFLHRIAKDIPLARTISL
jgi:hypothetical protein